MAGRPTTPRNGGSLSKAIIFVSLYALLLESLIQCTIVLHLYGIRNVDSKMAPSLILVLIASFFTLALVTLHSLLAWQNKKVQGFGTQKTTLHLFCTYTLPLTIAVWVAASVAGLVVVSQQLSCLPDNGNGSFWIVGISCMLHRVAVIVSVLSFVTVCLYFYSREIYNHPYDVSLLGVYSHKPSARDGSILSNSSVDSENSLKSDILYLCRQPDVTYGTQGVFLDGIISKAACSLDIQHPNPLRPISLRLETDPVCDTAASRTNNEASAQFPPLAELSGSPGVPIAPTISGHQRQKSSLSSLRKFLPKTLLISTSLPLSSDPQILALSNPDRHQDVEKQAKSTSIPTTENNVSEKSLASAGEEISPPPSTVATNPKPAPWSTILPARSRSITVNSAEAPEVLVPAPLKVRRSNTAQTPSVSRSDNRPNHPSYVLIPPNQLARRSVSRASSQGAHHPGHDRVSRQNSTSYSREQSQVYQFEPSQIPRYTQSQHHRTPYHHRLGQYYPYGNMTRRSDVEIIFPSTRRSRSTTCGRKSSTGRLSSIRETGSSLEEARVRSVSDGIRNGNIIDSNTYRGVNRTSMHFG